MPKHQYTLEERFWAKVNRDGPIPERYPELGSCWVWTAALKPNGYGAFAGNGKLAYAHRTSWILTFGKIPENSWVLHWCDFRPCVNPSHLFLGSPKDNKRDAIQKDRSCGFEIRVYRGEQNGNAKLCENDVREILRRASSESLDSLAKSFKVSALTIRRVVNGQTWKHVDGATASVSNSYPTTAQEREILSPRRSIEDRFWERVDPSGECWMWTGCKRNGYGILGIHYKNIYAHRLSWEFAFGKIPEGLLVCHKCDIRLCVRPDHLFLGDFRDNLMDAIRKGRRTYVEAPRGERQHNAKLTDEKVREALQRVASGEWQSVVAKSLGITPSTFGAIVKGKTWKHVERPPQLPKDFVHGENNGRSKLSDDKVREILRRAADREFHDSIAKSLGVSQTLVSGIVRGVLWKHVPRYHGLDASGTKRPHSALLL